MLTFGTFRGGFAPVTIKIRPLLVGSLKPKPGVGESSGLVAGLGSEL